MYFGMQEVLDNMRDWWFIEIFVVLAFLTALRISVGKVVHFVQKNMHLEAWDWRKKIAYILLPPCHFILWTLTLFITLEMVGRRFGFPGYHWLPIIRNILLVIGFAWLMLRWKKEFQLSLAQKAQLQNKPLDPGATLVLGKLVSMLVLVISALLILQIVGLDIVPLLAFGGIGAAAIGFAGKDVIANFFGGLMLYLNRSCVEGEEIQIPTSQIQGVVAEIGWYMTRIVDKEQRPVFLPNALFSTTYVINCSRMTHRRILESFQLDCGNNWEKLPLFTESLRAHFKEWKEIDAGLPVLVYVNKLDGNNAEIHLEIYSKEVLKSRFLLHREKAILLVYKKAEEFGFSMPVPLSRVQVEMTKECQRTLPPPLDGGGSVL